MRKLFNLMIALVITCTPAFAMGSPVSYASTGESLRQTIGNLEQSLGNRITLVNVDSETIVKGNFSGNSTAQFLNDFAKKMRLEWAFGKNEVFLADQNSQTTDSINAPNEDVAIRLQDLLITAFRGTGSSISTKLAGNTVFITGITPWVERVGKPRAQVLLNQAKAESKASNSMVSNNTKVIYAPKDPNQNGLMIFQLHNAWADDKRSTVNGVPQIVPGVATLFRQFTGMPALAPTQIYVNQNQSTRVEREPVANGAAPTTRSAAAQAGPSASNPSLFGLFSKAEQPDPMAVSNSRGVYADMRLNAVMVRDRVSLFENYKQLISSLDRSADMVQMDAFIVDINRSRMHEFGLNLAWQGGSIDPSGGATGAANVVLSRLGASSLLTRLRALESSGDSQFLTVPTVVSMNNMEAVFSARDNFYISVSGFQDSSLNKVTAETVLRVTPLIGNDNPQIAVDERRVKLLVNIQDATVDNATTASNGNLPRVLENQITTQAVVRAGDTLVIGGQVIRKRSTTQNGLPILSRIPGLKWLASSQVEQTTDYIRIYMVRPRILGEDSASAAKVAKDGNVNLDFASGMIATAAEQMGRERLPAVPVISSAVEQ